MFRLGYSCVEVIICVFEFNMNWLSHHFHHVRVHMSGVYFVHEVQSWSDKSQRFFFLDKIIDNSFAMFFWKKRIRNIVFTSKQIQSY